PSRPYEELRQERQCRPEVVAQKLFRAVSRVSFPESRNGRVDGHDKRRDTCGSSARDCRLSDISTTDEGQLVPHRNGGCGLHTLQPASGKGGQNIGRAGGARGAGGDAFAARIEHAAAADRSEQEWKIEAGTENRCSEIAARKRDGIAWSKCDRLEYPAVFAQC